MSTTTSKEARYQWRAERRAATRQWRAERSAARAVARTERRTARSAALLGLCRQLRPVVPLLIVTTFAGYGQVSYGVDAYSPTEWVWPARMTIALGVAVGIESIALYVAWHAHDALVRGDTGGAARLRRASYLLALGQAAVNYSHFSEGLHPSPAAVIFAAFSAVGPWLWGLHSRRARHLQLVAARRVDAAGAVFAAERWRAYPIRTLLASRWSIDYGVTDPTEAWEGYRRERVERRREREERRRAAALAAKAAAKATPQQLSETKTSASGVSEPIPEPIPLRKRVPATGRPGPTHVDVPVDPDDEPAPENESPEDRVKRLARIRARRARRKRGEQGEEG